MCVLCVCVCVCFTDLVCVCVCVRVCAEKLKVSHLCVLLFAEVKQCEAQGESSVCVAVCRGETRRAL